MARRGVSGGCETWMEDPVLLGFSPEQFPAAGLLPGSLPLPTRPLWGPWMGLGVGGEFRGLKDLSAVCFPCLLKVDTLLRMEVPTTLPPWRVHPQHCGFVL